MSQIKYIGPKTKINKKFLQAIFPVKKNCNLLNTKNIKFKKRPNLYSQSLTEKQKLKFNYNLSEKQFFLIFKRSKFVNREGNLNLIFLQNLELRVDNIIFRSGLVKTRRQARQLITHRHIFLNNYLQTIPSYTCNIHDIISIECKHYTVDIGINTAKDWLQVDSKKLKILICKKPNILEINKLNINLQLIIEFYNRYL